MDVEGRSTKKGANILTWPYNGGKNQGMIFYDFKIKHVLEFELLHLDGSVSCKYYFLFKI